MKIAFLCVVLFLAAFNVRADPSPSPSPKVDPIVGQWIWVGDQTVEFKADGTATSTSGAKMLWRFLNNPEVQRHYRLVWNGGTTTDVLSLSEDKNIIKFTNQADGARYTAKRKIEQLP